MGGNCGVPHYYGYELKGKQNSVALVIPVLNEGSRILTQLHKICEAKLDSVIDIILADGGSSDNSLLEVQKGQLGINTILVKSDHGGLSSQLRMAFDYCIRRDYQFVITMDGNNKDGINGIDRIRSKLEEGYDFVQGSRFQIDGISKNTPLFRYLGIRLFHAPLISLVAKFWYTDTTNGFRGCTQKLLKSSELSIFREVFQTYELLAYMPIRAGQLGLRIAEVGVERIYPSNLPTPTKIKGFRGNLILLQILIKSVLGHYNPKESGK